MGIKGFAHDIQIDVYKKQIESCAKYCVHIAILHSTNGNPNSVVTEQNLFGLSEFQNLVGFFLYHFFEVNI